VLQRNAGTGIAHQASTYQLTQGPLLKRGAIYLFSVGLAAMRLGRARDRELKTCAGKHTSFVKVPSPGADFSLKMYVVL